jgi:flagellar biosynthesis chaperone FliJ
MSEEEVKFSFQAGIPKEKIQVLDNVLNSLFSAINTKMKEADHFMKKVQNVQDSFHSHSSSPNRFEPLRDDHDHEDEEDREEEDVTEEDDDQEEHETEEDDHEE